MKINRSGFTLIEMMIVIMIVALLALIAVPQMANNRRTAQRSGCMNNLRIINANVQQYMLANATTTVPTKNNIRNMFQTRRFPTCPGGGNYFMPVNDTALPRCSLANSRGHRLTP